MDCSTVHLASHSTPNDQPLREAVAKVIETQTTTTTAIMIFGIERTGHRIISFTHHQQKVPIGRDFKMSQCSCLLETPEVTTAVLPAFRL